MNTMNDTLGESLSAFLDGELPRAEYTLFLRRVQSDARLRDTLSRYSIMGESSVALLARNRKLRRAGQMAGGFALAATVAGVAILWLQREQLPTAGDQIANAGQSRDSGKEMVDLGNSAGDEDFSYTVPAPAETGPAIPGGARLTDYVFAHSEYSTAMGRRNVLSSVLGEDPVLVDAKDPEADKQGARRGDPP
jgi:hypothetical protein